MTNFELEDIGKEKLLVIPVGSVEAHGRHLSMNNDNLIAQYLAQEFCRETKAILCPALEFGNTAKLVDFPGTIDVRPEILKEYLLDILRSYFRAGFKNIFIINAHKGNNEYLEEVVAACLDQNVKFIFYKDLLKDELDESYQGKHSNRLETELAMLAKEDSVDLSKAKDSLTEAPAAFGEKFDRKLMPDCVDGYPSKASLETARKVAERLRGKLRETIY